MKLNKAIKDRWSPRAFSEKPVSDEMIRLLFEAARWAPSARNEQPWQYFYAHRDQEERFSELVNLLSGNNPEWAQKAQVLIISVVKKFYDYKKRLNRSALHDLGAANVSIAIQASEMGLQVHQMAGFDKEKTIDYLKLDSEKYEPITFFAVGYPGTPEQLSEDLKKRELEPRQRKEIDVFVKKL